MLPLNVGPAFGTAGAGRTYGRRTLDGDFRRVD
jgi:hypothetical protein